MKALTATWLIIPILVWGCSGPKTIISPELEQVSYRVAVLTFASSGFLSSQKFGKFAADELANQLALKKRAFVVDRSVVNAVVAQIGIVSANVVTSEQLRRLAQNLNVQLVVLGEIRNTAEIAGRISERDTHLIITYRLLDPDSGSVLALISHQRDKGQEEGTLIKEMIAEMIDSMGGFKIHKR